MCELILNGVAGFESLDCADPVKLLSAVSKQPCCCNPPVGVKYGALKTQVVCLWYVMKGLLASWSYCNRLATAHVEETCCWRDLL